MIKAFLWSIAVIAYLVAFVTVFHGEGLAKAGPANAVGYTLSLGIVSLAILAVVAVVMLGSGNSSSMRAQPTVSLKK